MLADGDGQVHSGKLDRDIHLPSTAKHVILDFIARELPRWRDDPERPVDQAENRLTEYLCDHLSDAAYRSSTLSHVKFRSETGDETRAGRTIDLSIKPRGHAVIVEGRRHTRFQTLLPIECKRLPTPKGRHRDEREYVFSGKGSTGGIQRFKAGDHAAEHMLAAMIAYVQQENCAYWNDAIARWIQDLVAADEPGWSERDLLSLNRTDTSERVAVLGSSHQRDRGLPDIELRHIWVQMH